MTRNKVLALVPVVGLSFALLTVSAAPGHGYVSVPAAAFQPQFAIYSYTNDGNNVFNFDDSTQVWIAPVQLPHGATVTKVTFYWSDSADPHNARLDLERASWDSQIPAHLATVYSTGDGGWGSSEDTSINYAVIDTGYGYFVKVQLPKTATLLCGVTIEYTYPVSLPLVLRSFQSGLGQR